MSVLALAAALAAAAPPQDNVEARLQAGRAALSARDYPAAKREFTAALAADSGNPTAHLNLGILALIANNPTEGLRHFSLVTNDPRALIGRLDCELRLGRTAEARNTAKQLDGLAVSNPAAAEHIGRLLAGAGQYEIAGPFLRRASGAAAANLLGMVEEKSGNAEAALKAFVAAVRLEPANEDYRIDYAAALVNSGQLEEAMGVFRTAAQDFPNSARVHLGLGSALYLAGRHEPAARALLDAVRLQPSPRAFDLLGQAYESAGALQPQVRSAFEKYLRSEPPDAAAYAHYAAILHMAGGEEGKVRQTLATALRLQPGLPAAHLQLGIIEQGAGRWDAALKHYQRTAELDPKNASVRYRLATAYGKLGQQAKARAELAEFRRLKAQETAVRERP